MKVLVQLLDPAEGYGHAYPRTSFGAEWERAVRQAAHPLAAAICEQSEKVVKRNVLLAKLYTH